MKQINQCGVILLNYDMSKLLVVFQKESQKWGLPKGHMTKDEMKSQGLLECAKRELYEETGVYLNFIKHKMMGTLVLNDKFFFVVKSLSEIKRPRPLDNNEILKTKWINMSTICDFVRVNSCNSTLSKFLKTLMYQGNRSAAIITAIRKHVGLYKENTPLTAPSSCGPSTWSVNWGDIPHNWLGVYHPQDKYLHYNTQNSWV
jgi:ADP-ribose pyrophosphatase YjhB (NUDIX family)